MTVPGSQEAPSEPYQSLYRRFRPQRFDEVLGQEFVGLALRNAVREERVGHAYLFSGPRGTGKTSTARILAKALNCTDLKDGEPCGVCSSCKEIAAGTSLDVHELDAASNNGVDAMRDLVARAALGTPGRWKVYIVDEVHMLSAAASNALLKTLEEPPRHVVFVLATTDPQKVLPTIRSRTQHFEFRLLGPETLRSLLETVRQEAGLDLPEQALEVAVRRGRGSARDALSVLDQVAAAGIVEQDTSYLDQLAEALATRDPEGAMVALAKAVETGRDPLNVAAELADHLRQGFLSVVAPELVTVQGGELSNVSDLAQKMGLPALVRAVEALGAVVVDMREAPDPRLYVEVCLLRLTKPQVDDSVAALVERIDRLERAVAGGTQAQLRQAGASGPPGAATPAAAPPIDTSPEDAGAPARSLAAIRREVRAKRGAAASTSGAAPAVAQRDAPPAPAGPAAPAESNTDDGGPASYDPGAGGAGGAAQSTAVFPTRDELVQAWGDGLLASLPQKARARFRVGRFTEAENGLAVFALPNEAHRSYCEEVTGAVEEVLSERFGVRVKLELVIDPEERASVPSSGGSPGRRRGGSAPPRSEVGEVDPYEDGEPDFLDPEVFQAETDPAGAALSAAERLKITFPGAEEV